MKLNDLLNELNARKLIKNMLPAPTTTTQEGRAQIDIKGLAYDSRNVEKGYIFVARRGANKYVETAIKRGAVAIVLEEDIAVSEVQPQELQPQVDKIIVADAREALAVMAQKFYNNTAQNLKLIGVTGTYGKTTSTWLIKSIYETAGIRTGLIGTIEYQLPTRNGAVIIPAHHTTPESLDLHRIFAELCTAGAKACVMEVSSHAIALKRVYGLDFAIAGFTALGRDHLDFHRNLKEYEDTKLKLFSGLKESAIAVLNADDRTFARFKAGTKAMVVSYGTGPDCDIRGELSKSDAEGIEVKIKWHGKRGGLKESKIRSRLIGAYNLHNILLASTCALSDGIGMDAVTEGIEKVERVPGRFERVGRVIVDYAHTPEAIEAALKAAREITKGRVICIFGCGGGRDKGKRPLMGKLASEFADYVVLTTDNPRNEDPMEITKDIIKGMNSSNYEVILDRKEAIRTTIERSSDEDIVLLVGKGHENYQIYGELRVPWNDREVAREVQGM